MWFQLELAKSGKFNSQIHVEFMWEIDSSQELYDSEDDLDDRVETCTSTTLYSHRQATLTQCKNTKIRAKDSLWSSGIQHQYV